MIKEFIICMSLMDMNGVVNQENICNNIDSLHEVSKKYKVDSDLYVSMMWVESNFKTNIRSYTGKACGISQVIPKWTRPRMTCKELNQNPGKAMEQGARIYSLFKPYARGKDDINLCAYNQGYRCKGEKGEKYVKSGMGYAKKVKKFRRRLKREIKRKNKEYKSLIIYKEKLLRVISSIYKL